MTIMEQDTSYTWPGSIDEVTFALFSMFLYMVLDIMILTTLLAYRHSSGGLPIMIDSGQAMGAIILSWGVGWFAGYLRMNRVCSRRPFMSRDAGDMEAFKSLALGALFQLPLFAVMVALILA